MMEIKFWNNLKDSLLTEGKNGHRFQLKQSLLFPRRKTATESHKRALTIRQMVLGENHEDTAESYHWLGLTQYMLSDYSSATESHKRALTIRQTVLGENHEITAESNHHLGLTQFMLGDYSSATESHKRALKIRQTVLGENHEKTAESNHWLGLPNMCLVITPQPQSYTSAHWTSDQRFCVWRK